MKNQEASKKCLYSNENFGQSKLKNYFLVNDPVVRGAGVRSFNKKSVAILLCSSLY